MNGIFQHQQGLVEHRLFGFFTIHTVLDDVFSAIPRLFA